MGKKKLTFRGAGIEVTWDQELCIHVEECVRARGGAFEMGRKPWCQPDLAGAEKTAAVVERCPTGALHYVRDDGAEESPPVRNSIVVSPGGPLYARGNLQIEGAPEAAPGLRTRAALCRCGASGNKPFCDGRHRKADFSDCGAIGEDFDASATEPPTGVVEIRRIPNGPLMVIGDVELVSGSGRVAWRGKKAALCRCGASKNRPFCDGSHTEAGFEAE